METCSASWQMSYLGVEDPAAGKENCAVDHLSVSAGLEKLKAFLLEDEWQVSSSQNQQQCIQTHPHHNQHQEFDNLITSYQISVKDSWSEQEKQQKHTKYILGERKRREKINEKFIALSALVPGIKKLSKESVLCETVKYVKQLQQRLNALEENQSPPESVCVSESPVAENASHCKKRKKIEEDEDCWMGDDPKIDARIIQNKFLIRIHCANRKGLLVKSVMELDKLELTVMDASIHSFADKTLSLTFSGQMENRCNGAAADMVFARFFQKLNLKPCESRRGVGGVTIEKS